jgi:alpha-mannosidase
MRQHLIANSHIDPVWLWDKFEGIDEVLNTFRAACDRLDEYPELYFSASSLQFYDWCLVHDAPLFARIQAYVAVGRWEVTGGWWVEPDTNLPQANSVVEQSRVAQRFVAQHFDGRCTPVALLPDTFGHPASLPKLLARTGQKYFIFCRPTAGEKGDLPGDLFYWQFEGHRVLAYRLRYHYSQTRPVDEQLIRGRLADPDYDGRSANAFFFGVGDHGGGPTIAEIELYRRFIAEGGDLGFSTCAAFFAEAEQIDGIPTYEGDLHRHAVGCYSVLRDIKQGVRSAENGLAFAARVLDLQGASHEPLRPLWETTLFNQFHDILPGSCSPSAAQMAIGELGGVDAGWRSLAYQALKANSRQLPVHCPEGEFRVYNTLPWEVHTSVALESFQYFVPGAPLCNDKGDVLEVQPLLPDVRCNNRRWTFVDTLPAGACRIYHFDDVGLEAARSPSPVHYVAGDQIRAGRLIVQANGTIEQRTDSAAQQVLLPAPRFLVLDDDSDTWGHGVVRYDEVTGAFEQQSTAVLEGTVTSRLFQRWHFGSSRIDAIYSIYHELPWVDLEIRIDWAEDRRILKLELSPSSGAQYWHMQGPGGVIERLADGTEQPLHHGLQWLGLTGDVAVLQDGAFGGDCLEGRVRINLVRANLFGFNLPDTLDAQDPQQRTDQGTHAIRMRLLFAADAHVDSLERRTAEFLEPFLVLRESAST